MDKLEIAIYCFVTTDISTKNLQKCFLGSPLLAKQFLARLYKVQVELL